MMRPLSMVLCGVVFAGVVLGQENVSDNAPSAEPLPAYLEELQRLAQEHLAGNSTDGGSTTAPAAQRLSGPISRQEYVRYVGDADFTGTVEGDSIALTRPVIPRVIIRDRDALNYLFDCCAYHEVHPDSVRFIEIYDFSRSGFSNGDMMVVHPSGNSYILEGLDVDFLDSAARWSSKDQLRYRSFVRETGYMDDLVGSLEPPAYYDWEAELPELSPAEEEDQALRGIWGDVHRAVDKQYGRGVMEMYFARDDSTTTIEFWGYDSDDLEFQFLGQGEDGGRNDLLTVTVSDTLVTAYRSYVDLMVVKDSRVDTVYVKDSR